MIAPRASLYKLFVLSDSSRMMLGSVSSLFIGPHKLVKTTNDEPARCVTHLSSSLLHPILAECFHQL
jgi:hypothetical protein